MSTKGLATFISKNEAVNVNLSEQNLDSSGRPVSKNIHSVLNQLHRYRGPATEVPEAILRAVDSVVHENIFIAPSFIMSRDKDKMLSTGILKALIEGTGLGFDMLDSLENVGLMQFLERQKRDDKRIAYLREIYKIVAVFSMCSMGCDSLSEMPKEAIHAIVGFFRTQDGLRWKRSLWGANDVGIQCAREVILALARYTGDESLYFHAINHRVTSNRNRTWKAIQVSQERLDRELVDSYLEYVRESRTKPSEGRKDLMYMIAWLTPMVAGGGLIDILKVKNRPENLADFFKRKSGRITPDLVARMRRIFRFSNFLFDKYADDTSGSPCWPLVTLEEIEWAADQCTSTAFKPSRARSRALPERLASIASDALDEGEEGWPGTSGIFDEWVRDEAGKAVKKYCPAIVTLYRLLFRLPLRRGQAVRLDSGEGDVRRFNGAAMRWEENQGPLAGYWRKTEADLMQRGYAYEFQESVGQNITGLFVNTNKTGEPYYIPWQDEEIHRMLYELREWQEKYNPVSIPTKPQDYLDRASEYPLKTIEKLPHIFPLFRTPAEQQSGSVPLGGRLDSKWQHLMAETERRHNALFPDEQISIVKFQAKTGAPQSAIYKSHGLRVRGISNLHRSGVPIELISKMVAGHASIIMTLYYTVYEPWHIHDMLTKAAVETQARSAREFMEAFRTFAIEEMRARSATISDETLIYAEKKADPALFCNVDYGFCLEDGRRCDEGGPAIRKSKGKSGDKTVYGPVPGGGRNCVMCRFFVSGPPWLNQLAFHSTSLLEKIAYLRQHEREIQDEIRVMNSGVAADKIARAALRQRRDSRQSELAKVQKERLICEDSLFNTNLLIHVSLQIEKTSSSASDKEGALVANDAQTYRSWYETTPYETACHLTAGSRVFPIFKNERIENLRDRMQDRMMHNDGQVPFGFRADLTQDDCRRGHDRFAEFLARRVSRKHIQELATGHVTLEDLGLRKDLAMAIDEVIGKGPMTAPVNATGETPPRTVQ
ncbi:VPA1269 family protein [Rhizobium rhizogenes]|uniref:VPA1269 family protein n=1 Tax=Rhizobium rhizogenes TaxID=359 RepID=UPI0015734DCA|nr:VPA1269 family protein [Rhizobium rhizogenes]NTG08833.1 hypothetical protein [Rhizobium rhizogenes]